MVMQNIYSPKCYTGDWEPACEGLFSKYSWGMLFISLFWIRVHIMTLDQFPGGEAVV